MPIFRYICPCGKEFSELVKSHDEIVKCECGKDSEKQISAPNIGGMDKLGRSK